MMIEELDFALRSWDDLEVAYRRPRIRLAEHLVRQGRGDLRDRVHQYTYGTSNVPEIVWLRRRAK